jgi:hypothetical protein
MSSILGNPIEIRIEAVGDAVARAPKDCLFLSTWFAVTAVTPSALVGKRRSLMDMGAVGDAKIVCLSVMKGSAPLQGLPGTFMDDAFKLWMSDFWILFRVTRTKFTREDDSQQDVAHSLSLPLRG